MIRSLSFLLLISFSCHIYGYGVKSHEKIAEHTAPKDSTDNEFRKHLDGTFGFSLDDTYKYVDENGTTDLVKWHDLIYYGSRREDDIKPASVIDRPLNHFYNPLTDGTAWWADNATPDWAIGRNASGTRLNLPYQKYSLAEANNYLYKALTTPNLEDRKKWRQNYFYSLGHVLHLLADMGQPEHVRPDMHPIFEVEDKWYKPYVNYYSNYFGEWSLYEKYTDANISTAISRGGNYSAPHIAQARNLWTDATVGLSNYTNKNFVSEDTNFNNNDSSFLLLNEYTLPIAQPEKDCKPISELYSGTPPTSSVTGQPLSGNVCFISNTVYDINPVATSTTVNHRAASLSIFNREADDYHEACIVSSGQGIIFGVDTSCKRYTLNRWNFDAAHDYLIPRIISYGDALLDHLARGKMALRRIDISHLGDLQLHSQDHNIITQLPLNISNATDGGEDMTTGSLIAVISYVDSSGDIVFATHSDSINDVAPQRSEQVYTFKFSNGGFPVHLSDYAAYIQVIFRGKLGDEVDNIVVARKPLNELITTIDITTETPNSGIYALANHSGQETGFNNLKLKLSSTEALGGIIAPVVSHHINYCYTNDLKGEFNVGGQDRLCAASTYRSNESFSIAATQPSSILANSITTTGTEHTLNLSTPIPFNATDLKVEYYHFPDDPTAPIGIGVSDISEPTYTAVINNTDYYSISGVYYSIEEMLAGDMEAYVHDKKIYPTAIDLTIKTNGIPAATIGGLPAGGYARFAVLTSPNESTTAPFTLEMVGTGTNFTPRFASGINAAIAQLDSTTNTISYSFLPTLRGITAHYPIYFEQTRLGIVYGDVSTLPVIAPANQTVITQVQP